MNMKIINDFYRMKFAMLRLPLLCLMALSIIGCVSASGRDSDPQAVKARARAHSDLGAAYFQQLQFAVALEEFTIATQIDPTFSLAYNGLGLVNAALGQDSVAEMNFKKAIQLDPSNPESRNNYGGFLCARDRIDESIQQFMAAVKNPLYATPAIAYTNAGVCSMRKSDVANAEVYFQNALEIEPLLNSAAYQLASIQFKRNDALVAKKTLQNAMLNQPTPEMLWLAVQIERAVGSRDDEASYALQLRRQHPESEQAKMLQSGR